MAIAFRDSSTAQNNTAGITSGSINKPATVTNGDFMVLSVAVDPGASQNMNDISGWTMLGEEIASTSQVGFALYERIASSEPASYSITWAATSTGWSAHWRCYYSDAAATLDIDVWAITVDATVATTDPIAPITPTQTPTMLVAAAANQSNSSTYSSVSGSYVSLVTCAGNSQGSAHKAYTGTSATPAAAFTHANTRASVGYHLALYEVSGGTTGGYIPPHQLRQGSIAHLLRR